MASRALNTGQSTDYVFTSNTGNIPLLWAKGNDLNLAYHASKGVAMGTFVLNTPDADQNQFEVYPNPTVDFLNFRFTNNLSSAKIEVYNMLGQLVLSSNIGSTTYSIDTSDWKSGVYIVQINSKDFSQTKRIIKQ